MTTGEPFASVDDVAALFRPLSAAEQERAAALLPVVSDTLRQKAANLGRDLDSMIASGVTLENTAKAVTVGIVSRVLRETLTGEVVSQQSMTAGPYTQQFTYAIPGGGIVNAVMNADLKALGLLRQTVRARELYRPRPLSGDAPTISNDGGEGGAAT